ncbi:hypothetical protein NFI96_024514 [Prochilodus magdalenae]|nr:hypothetical protein NFI96_024514 [Prochilodus magdalenae]
MGTRSLYLHLLSKTTRKPTCVLHYTSSLSREKHVSVFLLILNFMCHLNTATAVYTV